MGNTKKRVKLSSKVKTVPNVIALTKKLSKMLATAILETIKPSIKLPTHRVFQRDETDMFTKKDQVRTLNDITLSSFETMGLDFMIKREKILTLYRIESRKVC